MQPSVIIAFILAYFALLLLISWFTGRGAGNKEFFNAGKSSPWYLVAFGMIGASLSGVTFLSVPGFVDSSQFSYMQVVLGYVPGYMFIAFILIPLYYRLNLVSIYGYLAQRLGKSSYKTGAGFFLLSRVIGASFRLFLVADVFHDTIFAQLGLNIPFVVTVCVTILLIWLYTFKGGIKTIVWTDTLQTTFMLIAVIGTIIIISQQMGLSLDSLTTSIEESKYSKMFFFGNINDSRHFIKQFLAGAFMAIVMTGLDQDMMQKNLTCKTEKDAKKNIVTFSLVLVFVNLFFLCLGALLFIYAQSKGIQLPQKADGTIDGDKVYQFIAMGGYLGNAVAIFFILGLIAAAYSSADSALTALTTSVCYDILSIEKKPEQNQAFIRKAVHVGISVLIILVILVFARFKNGSLIYELFKISSYTYGPLLGLFFFGLFTRLEVKDRWVPLVCIASPIICYFLNRYAPLLLNGYKFGFELLVVNGLLTFSGLWMLSYRKKQTSLR